MSALSHEGQDDTMQLLAELAAGAVALPSRAESE